MRNRHSRTGKILAATAAFVAMGAVSAVAQTAVATDPIVGAWAPADLFSCAAHAGLPWCDRL